MENEPKKQVLTPEEIQRLQDLELQRVIIKARQAGIPGDCLVAPRSIIKQMLDTKSGNVDELITYLYDKPNEWARTNTFIVIEGGTAERRNRVACATLLRAILVHSNVVLNEIGLLKRLSEISLHFTSFNQERFEQLARLRTIPCLTLTEFNKDTLPRGTTDARVAFQDLFSARRTEGRLTIVTLSEPSSTFYNHALSFGPVFGDLIKAVKDNDKLRENHIISIKCIK